MNLACKKTGTVNRLNWNQVFWLVFAGVAALALCYALLPVLASAEVDTTGLTDAANKGGEGIYTLLIRLAVYMALVILATIGFCLVFGKSPKFAEMLQRWAVCLIIGLVIVFFAPQIISFVVGILKDAGGGKWSTISVN